MVFLRVAHGVQMSPGASLLDSGLEILGIPGARGSHVQNRTLPGWRNMAAFSRQTSSSSCLLHKPNSLPERLASIQASPSPIQTQTLHVCHIRPVSAVALFNRPKKRDKYGRNPQKLVFGTHVDIKKHRNQTCQAMGEPFQSTTSAPQDPGRPSHRFS